MLHAGGLAYLPECLRRRPGKGIPGMEKNKNCLALFQSSIPHTSKDQMHGFCWFGETVERLWKEFIPFSRKKKKRCDMGSNRNLGLTLAIWQNKAFSLLPWKTLTVWKWCIIIRLLYNYHFKICSTTRSISWYFYFCHSVFSLRGTKPVLLPCVC